MCADNSGMDLENTGKAGVLNSATHKQSPSTNILCDSGSAYRNLTIMKSMQTVGDRGIYHTRSMPVPDY